MLIEGPYDAFAHLETLYLGVLARRTRVATNTRRVVEAAAPRRSCFSPLVTITGCCKRGMVTLRMWPERLACRPMHKPRGGAAKEWELYRTR
jgi:hypothetical protein